MGMSYSLAGKTGRLLLGTLIIGVLTKTTLAQSQEPIVSIGLSKSAAVSRSAARSTTGYDKRLTLPAKRQPLSKLMRDVQSATTGVRLSQAGSAKDVSVYRVVNEQTTRSLLPQIQQLFTDSEWQYQWQDRTPNSIPRTSTYTFRLWRQPVDARTRLAFARQQAHDRLSLLLTALHNQQQSGNDAVQQDPQEDPIVAYLTTQPMYRSQIAMLGTLPSSQINGVLAGQLLTLKFPAVSPQQQDLITQAIGGTGLGIATAPDGETFVDFDARNLSKTGYAVVQAIPEGTDPGELSLSLLVYTEPGSNIGAGGDVLYPDPFLNILPKDLAAAANPPVAEAAPPADTNAGPAQTAPADVPAVKVVTIDTALKTLSDQSPLEAYLGAFAAQTHFSILGLWADKAKEPLLRLPQSITQRPVKEALDTLARTYHARYIVEDQTVLFRMEFPTKPAPAGVALTTMPRPK